MVGRERERERERGSGEMASVGWAFLAGLVVYQKKDPKEDLFQLL